MLISYSEIHKIKFFFKDAFFILYKDIKLGFSELENILPGVQNMGEKHFKVGTSICLLHLIYIFYYHLRSKKKNIFIRKLKIMYANKVLKSIKRGI